MTGKRPMRATAPAICRCEHSMACRRGPPPVSKRSGDGVPKWSKDGRVVDFGLLFSQLLKSMARNEDEFSRLDNLEGENSIEKR